MDRMHTIPAVAWSIAKGSCGLNLGETEVHGAYVNGIALFAFEGPCKPSGLPPYYKCVVIGHITCGGESLKEAQEAGVRFAQQSTEQGRRKLTRKQFDYLMNSTLRYSTNAGLSSMIEEPGLAKRMRLR